MWECIDFWANRYQTLVAAAVAIVGIYVASRPVWRQVDYAAIQVDLLKSQMAEARRERLAARYNMIKNVMGILDYSQWMELAAGEEYREDSGFGAEKALAFQQKRISHVAVIRKAIEKIALQPEVRKVIDQALVDLEGRLEISRDSLEGIIKRGHWGGRELEFHATEQPDRDAEWVLNYVQKQLLPFQDQIVADIVAPDH